MGEHIRCELIGGGASISEHLNILTCILLLSSTHTSTHAMLLLLTVLCTPCCPLIIGSCCDYCLTRVRQLHPHEEVVTLYSRTLQQIFSLEDQLWPS